MTAPNTPAPAGDDEGLPEQGERYCLACRKPGHFTTECWSTHGLNTPADRELSRLCLAFHELSALREQLAEAVEANNMKDLQIAELRERLAEAVRDSTRLYFLNTMEGRRFVLVQSIIYSSRDGGRAATDRAALAAKENPATPGVTT